MTGLAAADFTIGGTATGWTVASVTGSGVGPYTITLSGGTAGTVSLTLAANAVSDTAGNNGPASASSAPSVTVDRSAPAVSSFTAPASPTNATSLPYSLSFSKSVTGLAAADFTIGGTATGWTVASVTGSGVGPYTITLSGGTAGTVSLTLAANAVSGHRRQQRPGQCEQRPVGHGRSLGSGGALDRRFLAQPGRSKSVRPCTSARL